MLASFSRVECRGDESTPGPPLCTGGYPQVFPGRIFEDSPPRTGLKLNRTGPYKVIDVKSNERYGLEKVGPHEGLYLCGSRQHEALTDPEWKDKIITADETWVYGYDPETKPQSAEWRG
ncbi:hypothetical protein LAZ67_5004291 [Cordylochernes scorpioides]|uniref:Uncharacterized protein n=1 Tax=Cordylochernes scorpioides TaxID=51811 RepID=A0ABY6KHT5_9ARAC|nr:hypothetical protein LAZ67_5004291 [Cordylochernes scorpioides]